MQTYVKTLESCAGYKPRYHILVVKVCGNETVHRNVYIPAEKSVLGQPKAGETVIF